MLLEMLLWHIFLFIPSFWCGLCRSSFWFSVFLVSSSCVLCAQCCHCLYIVHCSLSFRFSLTFYVVAIPFNISVVLVANTGQYTRYMHALLYCMRLDYCCSFALYKWSGFFLFCLAPSKTFASYISGIDMVNFWFSASYYTAPLNWISIVLGNWKAIHR